MPKLSFLSSPLVAEQKSKLSILEFIVTFIVLFFVTNTVLKYLFPQQFGNKDQTKPSVVLSVEKETVRVGNDPVVLIRNDLDKDLILPKRCPQPLVDIAYIERRSDGTEQRSDLVAIDSVVPCTELLMVKAHSTEKVNLAGWKYSLFERTGQYEASLGLPDGLVAEGTGARLTTTLHIAEPGFITKVFRTFVTKPLFNGLLFIASFMPGHNLGLAIIVLTILVKLILLVPNRHALEGQKKIQDIQPRMEEIKKKYPGDTKRVQEETMKLWKEMKINPLQSCLPTLLQFPILIGLFYVISNGVTIETSRHLLYSFYTDLPLQYLGNTLLGFDLLKPSRIVFPIGLVLLQFLQMKMMMKKKAPANEIVVKPATKKSWMPNIELDQQTVMTYALPLMIGFFALQFPVAVSLYWGVSTVFGIGQQWVVMRKKG
ncbi:YidC/Oxa1 family membrane protein insertase [Candidatus Peribacteria bacterium]|nr:YidC/Oxa1 family membrane protein insertase [Candidatus Peribacteria bacterium]